MLRRIVRQQGLCGGCACNLAVSSSTPSSSSARVEPAATATQFSPLGIVSCQQRLSSSSSSSSAGGAFSQTAICRQQQTLKTAATATTPRSPYSTFVEFVTEGNLSSAVAPFEAEYFRMQREFSESKPGDGKVPFSLKTFCEPFPEQAADYATLLIKTYYALKRMDIARDIFMLALSDVPNLGATFFDSWLQLLSFRSTFSREEGRWVMQLMKERNILWTEKTYLSLLELHVRMDVDPRKIWDDLLSLPDDGNTASPATTAAAVSRKTGEEQKVDDVGKTSEVATTSSAGSSTSLEDYLTKLLDSSVDAATKEAQSVIRRSIQPSPCMLRTMAQNVTFYHKDVSYQIEVMRRLIKSSSVDTKMILSVFQTLVHNHNAGSDHAVWMLFELEQRIVFERRTLKDLIQRTILVQLIFKCSKAGDHRSAGRVLALMERHLMARTADVLSLLVVCYANAGEVEKALDAVEEMHRKSMLGHTDPFKKHVIDSISVTLPRHFLQTLADSLHTVALLDRAYFHLEQRHKTGQTVSVHSLDLVVLACAKLGDEERAAETIEAYPSLGLVARTQSYNYLLMACGGRQKSRKHSAVFAAMQKHSVVANAFTYRLLIRQALDCDDIVEALTWLESVKGMEGVRLEPEMVLPILQRAGAVGDVDTATKLTMFALDNFVSLDGTTLKTISKKLKEEFSCDVSELESQIPNHEKLRSNVARRR